jgi:UDP-N-acetylglucosamine 2-epimerase (non-hydrolysing)
VRFACVVHPTGAVRRAFASPLANESNVTLLPPLAHQTFVDLLMRADLVVTDSGGVQEEAETLGLPLIVVRHRTERMEAVQSGDTWLVPPERRPLLDALETSLQRAPALTVRRTIHGDGTAAVQIVEHLAELAAQSDQLVAAQPPGT